MTGDTSPKTPGTRVDTTHPDNRKGPVHLAAPTRTWHPTVAVTDREIARYPDGFPLIGF
jgi:hypothetical protein